MHSYREYSDQVLDLHIILRCYGLLQPLLSYASRGVISGDEATDRRRRSFCKPEPPQTG
jgi:hypothetical protein